MAQVTLPNGVSMPALGFGLWSVPGGEKTYVAVRAALKAGFRHIDTAHRYQNERSVGQALIDSGIPRDEVWLTSKLWIHEMGQGVAMKAIEKMLERMQVNYLDTVYIHQPYNDYLGAWKDLETALKTGKVRSIGLSNFDFSDEIFSSVVDHCEIKPQLLQIECHPYAQRKHWQDLCRHHNIQLESWYSLGGKPSNGALFSDPTIIQIAEAHHKTPPQVVIRWHIREGFSLLTGSTNPSHIRENYSVFDFELTKEEMESIRALDKEQRFAVRTYEESYERIKKEVIVD